MQLPSRKDYEYKIWKSELRWEWEVRKTHDTKRPFAVLVSTCGGADTEEAALAEVLALVDLGVATVSVNSRDTASREAAEWSNADHAIACG